MQVIPVAAAVVSEGERFLLTQRPPGKPLEMRWEFPGGKLERGEAPEDALAREMREELGVDVRVGPVLDARLNGEYMVLFYACERIAGNFRLIDVKDARFVTLAEARTLPMIDQDRETMEKLARMGRLTIVQSD